jgi:DNA-binding CsgD family transcriptional regulator
MQMQEMVLRLTRQVTREYVTHLLRNQGMTVAKIAEQQQCSPATVRRLLKKSAKWFNTKSAT